MSEVRQQVRALYEAVPYPAPPSDLDEYASGRQVLRGMPGGHYRLLWPRGPVREELSILIAGCGSAQAPVTALTHPRARVVGIDICRASLAHSRMLMEKYDLRNLELRELPVEAAGTLGETFDLVVCTGVLHHLADPDRGLTVLRDCLKPEGVLYLMVYGRYGRLGVYLAQEYCRRLGVTTAPADLAELREAVQKFPAKNPLLLYAARYAEEAKTEAFLADSFLHPCDRPYTVPELYAWLDRCGVVFRRWLNQAPYLPSCSPLASTDHGRKIAARPEREQHALMELYWGSLTQHTFYAGRTEQPDQRVDFARDEWPSFVPRVRPEAWISRQNLRAGVVAELRTPPGDAQLPAFELDPLRAHLFDLLSPGRLTLAELIRESRLRAAPAEIEAYVRDFVQALYELDLVEITLPY